jgi:hypothetical protein
MNTTVLYKTFSNCSYQKWTYTAIKKPINQSINNYIGNRWSGRISCNLELSHSPLVSLCSLPRPNRCSQVCGTRRKVNIQCVHMDAVHVIIKCDTLREISTDFRTNQTGPVSWSTRCRCLNKYVVPTPWK